MDKRGMKMDKVLRDCDDEIKEKVKSRTKALYSELLDLNSQYAIDFADWMLDKIIANKNHEKEIILRKMLKNPNSKNMKQTLKKQIKKTLPENYPSSLESGDVIHVKFGIGYGGEISQGHYAIILSRKGSMFLVAPLTKSKQPDIENIKKFNDLNLPGSVKTGYVNFGQIRYIHFRRIESIKNIDCGKINIGTEEVDDIFKKWNNIIKENNRKNLDKRKESNL